MEGQVAFVVDRLCPTMSTAYPASRIRTMVLCISPFFGGFVECWKMSTVLYRFDQFCAVSTSSWFACTRFAVYDDNILHVIKDRPLLVYP